MTTLTLTLSEQQRRGVERFTEALVASGGPRLSLDDAVRVLVSTACSAWMDADPIGGPAPHIAAGRSEVGS